MNELKAKLIDVEILKHEVVLSLEAEIDGEEYTLDKTLRLGKWDEDNGGLVDDEATHDHTLEVIENVFGITDLGDFSEVIGNEYDWVISEEGSVFFEEPAWYAERKIVDDLRANVVKPDSKLEEKSSKAVIEHVTVTKYGVVLYLEVTGKAGKGTHVVSNFRFTKKDKDGNYNPDYKVTKRQESRIKTLFEINEVEQLKDLVGEVVGIKYESYNGTMFVSCSGLDE